MSLKLHNSCCLAKGSIPSTCTFIFCLSSARFDFRLNQELISETSSIKSPITLSLSIQALPKMCSSKFFFSSKFNKNIYCIVIPDIKLIKLYILLQHHVYLNICGFNNFLAFFVNVKFSYQFDRKFCIYS